MSEIDGVILSTVSSILDNSTHPADGIAVVDEFLEQPEAWQSKLFFLKKRVAKNNFLKKVCLRKLNKLKLIASFEIDLNKNVKVHKKQRISLVKIEFPAWIYGLSIISLTGKYQFKNRF